MGKKAHHEEHVNLEAWVVSYADMLTLLFALFVVLYALGEIKLAKLKEVSQSIALAFHFEGAGGTDAPGPHEKGEKRLGKVPDMIPLLTAQKEEVVELIFETLPRRFEQVSGNSLEIVQQDDTVTFKAPLSAYFEPDVHTALRKNDLADVLGDLIRTTKSFTAHVRLRIEAPSVVIGTNPRDGTYLRSAWLCHRRLEFLHRFALRIPNVLQHKLLTEFLYSDTPQLPPSSPRARNWEDRATLSIAFSNTAK